MAAEEKQCAFCSRPENKERTVLRTEFAWSFLTNIPITPGHTLICPVRCVATLEGLDPLEVVEIFEQLSLVKQGLRKMMGAEGFNIAWNEGEVAGQSVSHFHLHVVPRKPGDAGIVGDEPRKFLYRPGSREKSPEDELQATARLIRAQL